MKTFNPAAELALIQKEVTNFDPKKKPRHYLDTGSTELNNQLGHPKRGIPYGTLIEIAGKESGGKSAAALDLLAEAQADGAYGIWFDAENSFEQQWALRRGVEVGKLAIIGPYVGEFTSSVGKKKGKKELRMITCEEQCDQAQQLIKKIFLATKGKARFFMVVDSATALQTREEEEAGVAGQNMRTKGSQASFFSQLCRRWIGMAQAMNVTIVFINQIRVNPMQMFGNPEYTPCGNALKFYCHVRMQMRRVKGGRLMHGGKQVGIKGYMKTVKNKRGGLEFSEIGYKIGFYGEPAVIEIISMKDVKKEE